MCGHHLTFPLPLNIEYCTNCSGSVMKQIVCPKHARRRHWRALVSKTGVRHRRKKINADCERRNRLVVQSLGKWILASVSPSVGIQILDFWFIRLIFHSWITVPYVRLLLDATTKRQRLVVTGRNLKQKTEKIGMLPPIEQNTNLLVDEHSFPSSQNP